MAQKYFLIKQGQKEYPLLFQNYSYWENFQYKFRSFPPNLLNEGNMLDQKIKEYFLLFSSNMKRSK